MIVNYMKNNVKKNYVFNLMYQIVALINPLVVTPYIARVLGSAGVGQYSFTYSISTYFVLFASFGFGYYAQREIARYQGDKKNQSIVFWEIIICRLISVTLSLIIYLSLISIGVFNDVYVKLLLILLINIIATAFDVVFLFQGNEEFGIIAIRNIIIKILGVIMILLFVKDTSDVWLYALCQVIILVISNLSLWTRVPIYVQTVRINKLNLKRHFKPTLRLFIPTIATSVYTMFDKTLIGLLIPGVNQAGQRISDIENGFYDQSEKLVKMAMTIITSLGTIMIPRNSQAIASGEREEFKRNINGALKFVLLIGTPVMFGLAAIANNLSPWFFGTGYEKVPNLIMICSPLILIIGLSNVVGLQYLIPLKEDKKYTIAVVTGAVVNVILNIFLIRLFWSYGACIATVVAEIVITSILFNYSKKEINVIELLKNSWKYVLSGIVMFFVVYIAGNKLSPSVSNTCLLILIGIGVYIVLLFSFKDDLIRSIFNNIIFRIKKK